MFSITINAATAAELGSAAAALARQFGSPAASPKVMTAIEAEAVTRAVPEGGLGDAEARRIAAGTATVSTPKAETAAAKKARLAAEAAAAAAAEAETVEEEVDPLADETAAETEVTLEDLRAAFVEMKEARSDKPTLVADIVKEFGGGQRLVDIPAEKFGAVLARVKAEIAKKKK